MHEAGIAIAVAAEIRERRLDPAAVRLLVTGGHGDREAFDAALRAHLVAAAPDLGLGAVRIVHRAAPRLCTHCLAPFTATDERDACPACGGPGIAAAQPESIELAWDEPAGEERSADESFATESHATEGSVHERHSVVGHAHRGPEGPRGRDSRPSTPAPAGERL